MKLYEVERYIKISNIFKKLIAILLLYIKKLFFMGKREGTAGSNFFCQ